MNFRNRFLFFPAMVILGSFLSRCGGDLEISNKAGCAEIKRQANFCTAVGLVIYTKCVQDEVNRVNAEIASTGTISTPQTLGCTVNFLAFSLYCAAQVPSRCADEDSGDGSSGSFP